MNTIVLDTTGTEGSWLDGNMACRSGCWSIDDLQDHVTVSGRRKLVAQKATS